MARPLPRWLQDMMAPTAMLWLYALAYVLASAAVGEDGEWPKRADLVSRFTFPLILASWVLADSRKRRLGLWYDYDSFVFFAWPVVVPAYLFRTRGVRALLTLLCFAGIWLAAGLIGSTVLLLAEYAK
jgi:hypothetical protein